MSDNWYFKLFGDQFGPVTFEELQHLAQIGKLSKTDPVRSAREENWQTAGNVIDFTRMEEIRLESGIIPMSTMTDWDDGARRPKSAPAPSASGSSSELPSIDDIVLSDENDTDRQSATLDQFLKKHSSHSFKLGDQNDASGEDSHFELEGDAAKLMVDPWYVKVNGEEAGPFSPLELQMKIRRGEVARNDFLRKGTTGAWQRAQRVDQFKFPNAPKPTLSFTPPPETLTDTTTPSPTDEGENAEAEQQRLIDEARAKAEDAKARQRAEALAAFFAESNFEDDGPDVPDEELDEQPEPTSDPLRTTPAFGSSALGSTPIPPTKAAVAAASRKKNVGAGFHFELDLGRFSGTSGIIAASVVGFMALGVVLYFFNPFKTGGRQLNMAEQLWTEVQAKTSQSDFKSAATSVYLPQAQELWESIKPIPNVDNKVIAHLKAAVKDGLIPYLERYPENNEEGKETIEYHLDAARITYESGNY
ncbi:MAG: hypothetical protein CMJ46_15185 [Planctomyces sp.]|nr:hypothetical protein [Planctomyces sp.]